MIIADDFTGALDTGIQFVKNHVKTAVFADDRQFSAGSCTADAVVINSDTRNASSEIVGARRIPCRWVPASRDYYKKTIPFAETSEVKSGRSWMKPAITLSGLCRHCHT